MAEIKRKKCCNCNKFFRLDPRIANRQKYCRQPKWRKASKAAIQQNWLQKLENQNYFRGPQNVERVEQCREANAGYRY